MNLFGVRIDNLSKKELLEKVDGFMNSEKFYQIATVNPEFLLTAQKDLEFKNILNNCDLNVADGFGIKLAFWRFGETLKARVAGIDLMEEVLKIAEKNNFKIFLVASSRGLSSWEEASQAITKRFPKLEVGGINLNYNDHEKIKNSKLEIQNYEIIFANLGAPDQEKYLYSLKTEENSLPHHLWTDSESGSDNLQPQRCRGKIRLAMGVGGSFDYLTGKISRAPVFLQKIGLEWFWRLIQQPRRIKRIWNAVIIFPLKVIFTNNFYG